MFPILASEVRPGGMRQEELWGDDQKLSQLWTQFEVLVAWWTKKWPLSTTKTSQTPQLYSHLLPLNSAI
jgi:hypothetical protein